MKFAAFKVAVDISAERSPKTKELNIVGLDEAKGTQIIEFFLRKSKSAEMVNLSIYFIYHFGCKLYIFITTFKIISTIEIGMLMENNLIHIELIKVGIEKTYNNWRKFHHNLSFPF
jgi:hypothetical protein